MGCVPGETMLRKEKRAAWGLGRAPGVSRKETLAPASSKKSGRLGGCSPAASVFLGVAFRSQGLSMDPWGSRAQREAWSFLWDSEACSQLPWTDLCVTDVCRECCLWRLWGESLLWERAAAWEVGGLDSSLCSPHVLCDLEQVICPSRNHTLAMA